MPYSIEQQQRHKSIDKALTNFESLLNVNDTSSGQITPANSTMYRFWLDRLVVPNIREGIICLGEVAMRDENYIPIVAILPDEMLYRPIESIPPMPLQEQVISDMDLMPSEWTVLPEDTTCESYPDIFAVAVTSVFEYEFDDGTTASITGRPIILINEPAAEAYQPDVLAHEIQHVDQFALAPVSTYVTFGDLEDHIVSDELEAITSQLEVVKEMERQKGANDHTTATLSYISFILKSTNSPEELRKLLMRPEATIGGEGLFSEERRAQPFNWD